MIKQKISHSFSKAADTYDNNAGLQAALGDRLIQLVLDHINPENIHSILDLGVGTGLVTSRLLNTIQASPDTQLTACDLSYAMLTRARDRFNNNKNNKNNINFFQADFDKLPFRKNLENNFKNNTHFDLIFSNMSLQWSEDIINLINKLKLLLSSWGVLALSIPLKFTHPEIILPYSLNYQSEFLVNRYKKYILKDFIEWPFDSLYDFIQFYKKTGANLCFGKNRSQINISRDTISTLKTKLGAVSLEAGFLILRRDHEK